jgi:GRAM domain
MTVLDNDETYAMDEFYFSFFSRTREAFTKLSACLESKPAKPFLEIKRPESSGSTQFKDSVKDTTTFIRTTSPKRDSFDGTPRKSIESHHDFMDDAELLESDEPPKSPGRRTTRPKIRRFVTGLAGHRSSSSNLSPHQTHSQTFSESFDRITPSQTPTESWSDTGKMLWSRGVTNVTDWVRQRSAEVGSQVTTILSNGATSTINAGVGKVGRFWNGDLKLEQTRWVTEEMAKDLKDQNPQERFQTHFALPPSEILLGAYYGYVFRTFPFYGKMYISPKNFCFRSLLPGIRTKVFLSLGVCLYRWSFLLKMWRRLVKRRRIIGRISVLWWLSEDTKNFFSNLVRKRVGMNVFNFLNKESIPLKKKEIKIRLQMICWEPFLIMSGFKLQRLLTMNGSRVYKVIYHIWRNGQMKKHLLRCLIRVLYLWYLLNLLNRYGLPA